MKKIILILFTIALLLPIAVFAQETPQDLISVVDGANSIADFFVSLAALVPLVTVVAAYINKALKAYGVAKQVIAWLVSIALSFIAAFFKLGMFADLVWWMTLIYGFAVGLAANGFFDIKIIQAILSAIGLQNKKR